MECTGKRYFSEITKSRTFTFTSTFGLLGFASLPTVFSRATMKGYLNKKKTIMSNFLYTEEVPLICIYTATGYQIKSFCCNTGAGNITSHRLREYEVKELRSPACYRQQNAIFSPDIHATDGK